MKSFGVWMALGVLCIGTAGAATSCGHQWDLADGPSWDDVQDSTGTNGGVGGEGTAGTGGLGGGTGGTSGGEDCGNGRINTGEICDDGNQTDGDGCSSTCQMEACWDCSGAACEPLDANSSCNGMQVCDGKGKCGDCVPYDTACDNCKNCGGSTCDAVADCASETCVAGICRSATGSTCTDAVECASDFCLVGSPSVCAKCENTAQCTSGSCDKGQCLAAIGEPCDSSLKCAGGLKCIMNLCKGTTGAKCKGDYQCESNRCVTGVNSCAPCATNQDCAFGMCKMGACPSDTIPDGEYCIEPGDCASNNCMGFPRRCEPAS
jgi:cysteine-rich repeat protein